jgi:hypothetical protein
MTRMKSGELHRIFPSALPNGSHKTRRPGHIFCIFDTVFHEADETFYILDFLTWNGVHLCKSSLDCRSRWAQSQFTYSDAAKVCSQLPKLSISGYAQCMYCKQRRCNTNFSERAAIGTSSHDAILWCRPHIQDISSGCERVNGTSAQQQAGKRLTEDR